MAQRSVGWRGPELWVVTPQATVLVGASLRDLPPGDAGSLASVRRAVDPEGRSGSTFALLLVHEGCISGPWVPSDVRRSREHVVCVTRDVVPPDTALPAQCSDEVMSAISNYAQKRLQDEQAASGTEADAPPKPTSPTQSRGQSEWSPHSGERWRPLEQPAADATVPEVAEAEAVVSGDEPHTQASDWPGGDEAEDLDASFVDDEAYAEAVATARSIYEDGDELMRDAGAMREQQQEEEEASAEEEMVDEDFEHEYDDPIDVADARLVAADAQGMDEQFEPPAEECAIESTTQRLILGTSAEDAPHVPRNEPPAGSEGVISAAALVRDAQDAWLQAKDPSRLDQDRTVMRGSLQRIYMRQEGTDLRNLSATEPHGDDENARTQQAAPPSGQQQRVEVVSKPVSASPHPAARGRWALQQPVVAPLVRQPEKQARPTAQPKRGGKLRSTEEGGPAAIVASAEHMRRLEQLRQRTMQARTAWQTSSALEALRVVATQDDPALSLSVLCAVVGRQVEVLGAAEVNVALGLARSLLVPGTARSALKPLAALMHAVRRLAGSGGGATDDEIAAAARASLVREARGACSQLDELRVTRDAAARSCSFEEQFAFGQAIALAREAGREALRAFGDGVESMTAPPAALARSSAPPAQATGRRAW